MNWEVGWAVIAQIVKVAHQPLHSSIRVNWEFSSNCGIAMASLFLRLMLLKNLHDTTIQYKSLEQSMAYNFISVSTLIGQVPVQEID